MAEMKDAAFLAEADSWIDAHWEEIVEEIGNLVAVPSVVDFDAATPEHPSGPDAHAGMTAALDLASRLGFPTTDEAGEIGWADLEGESETQLGMICHADVVVPGVGWTSDPWTMQRRDGFLIGRGVLDDKGPLVVSLYAMKFFAERCEAEGKKLPYTIRMLVGTNEETGTMKDVGYYLAHHKAPAFLFTSDAEFSVCYGEKGGFDGLITSKKLEGGNIVDFTTGDAATNAVPSQATLVVKANPAELPAPAGFEVTDAGDGCAKIVATGKGGHASLPEGTVNAIGMLARYTLEHDLCSEDEAEFLRLAVKIMDSTDGSSIGIDTADAYFDPLTCIAGTIHMVDTHLELTIDIRYPTSTTNDELQAKIADCRCRLPCDLRKHADPWFRSSSTRRAPQSKCSLLRITTPPASTATPSPSAAAPTRANSRALRASDPKTRMTNTPSGSVPCTAPMRVFPRKRCAVPCAPTSWRLSA